MSNVIIMARADLTEDGLKKLLKEALVETLQEQRELLHDVFAEVLEDIALAEAIREGRQTEELAERKFSEWSRAKRKDSISDDGWLDLFEGLIGLLFWTSVIPASNPYHSLPAWYSRNPIMYEVEGDRASLAELCALLSVRVGMSIKQSLLRLGFTEEGKRVREKL